MQLSGKGTFQNHFITMARRPYGGTFFKIHKEIVKHEYFTNKPLEYSYILC